MDKVSKKARSRIMRAIKSTGTKPEAKARKALSKAGFRYRLHYGKHKIDIAFPKKRIAIFVDGCFWHCCPKHGHLPKSNKPYWHKKLERNRKRDQKINKELKKQGWKVIRVWEHDLIHEHHALCFINNITAKTAKTAKATHAIRGN